MAKLDAYEVYEQRLKEAACSCWYSVYLATHPDEQDMNMNFLKLALEGLALRGWQPVFKGHYLSFRKGE